MPRYGDSCCWSSTSIRVAGASSVVQGGFDNRIHSSSTGREVAADSSVSMLKKRMLVTPKRTTRSDQFIRSNEDELTANEIGSFLSARWNPRWTFFAIGSMILHTGFTVRIDFADAGHTHSSANFLFLSCGCSIGLPSFFGIGPFK